MGGGKWGVAAIQGHINLSERKVLSLFQKLNRVFISQMAMGSTLHKHGVTYEKVLCLTAKGGAHEVGPVRMILANRWAHMGRNYNLNILGWMA